MKSKRRDPIETMVTDPIDYAEARMEEHERMRRPTPGAVSPMPVPPQFYAVRTTITREWIVVHSRPVTRLAHRGPFDTHGEAARSCSVETKRDAQLAKLVRWGFVAAMVAIVVGAAVAGFR